MRELRIFKYELLYTFIHAFVGFGVIRIAYIGACGSKQLNLADDHWKWDLSHIYTSDDHIFYHFMIISSMFRSTLAYHRRPSETSDIRICTA